MLSAAIQLFDRTAPLLDGRVIVEDVLFHHVLPEVGVRGLETGTFSIAEIPLAHYVFMRSQGDPITGIPVFTDRLMLHRYVWARRDTKICSLADFGRATIIVPRYFMTSSVWHRGLMEASVGITPSDIAWVTTKGERDPRLRVPEGVDVTVLDGRSHLGMDALLVGDGDVLMTEGTPLMTEVDRRNVVSLSEDIRDRQRRWYDEQRLNTITHVIAIRQDVLDERPEAAIDLQRGFDQAKQTAYHSLENERLVSLPDFRGFLDKSRIRYGADPWPYGVEATNRAEIELFLEFAHGQGLVEMKMTVEDLFPPGVGTYKFRAALRYGTDLHSLSSLKGIL